MRGLGDERVLGVHALVVLEQPRQRACRGGCAAGDHADAALAADRDVALQDDGRGFPADPKRTGMGLHTMRYRASMIGGLLDIRRSSTRGTVVTCSFPTQRLNAK